MNREAASGGFFYRAKVKKHGPALGWGAEDWALIVVRIAHGNTKG
jgi:hypothetical protein